MTEIVVEATEVTVTGRSCRAVLTPDGSGAWRVDVESGLPMRDKLNRSTWVRWCDSQAEAEDQAKEIVRRCDEIHVTLEHIKDQAAWLRDGFQKPVTRRTAA